MAKVVIAMSGGVDSSVAAALLRRAGYECVGVFMCLGSGEVASRESRVTSQEDVQPVSSQSEIQNPKSKIDNKACCSPQDAADAFKVAQQLGIEFQVLNFQADMENIIRYFVDEYRRGRTPNPCVMCNARLKFGKLIDFADAVGADFVATGHYARMAQGRLCRGVDWGKDQSYALFGMARENLGRVLLPIGEYRKSDVRGLAAEFGLPVHDKQESQEICFVADDDYKRLLAERAPELLKKGKVVNPAGKVLGEHEGIFGYTIGQRRGLGIALGEPAYVIGLDAVTNTVVLGSREQLRHTKLVASRVNWLITPPPAESFAATVQIRYNHRGAAARVTPAGSNTVQVDFAEPVMAITPGQAAVFYDEKQRVIGGGWIEHADD